MGEEKYSVYKKRACQRRESLVGAGEVMDAGVTVGAGEVVGAGVTVGAGEVVGAGVAVGAGDVLRVRAVCKTAERRRLPLCLSPSRGLIS